MERLDCSNWLENLLVFFQKILAKEISRKQRHGHDLLGTEPTTYLYLYGFHFKSMVNVMSPRAGGSWRIGTEIEDLSF
jgi:hypothetical protein